ncbi:MAG: putative glycolipid transfer protein [Monoraphidium minutum]|nr:MAG: putative glycolipid transfer protein [Monoraphidium minutum]
MDGSSAAADADAAAPRASLFAAALDKAPGAKDAGGAMLTDGFLDLCQLVLPLIESFGAAFMIVRNDISNNIERIRVRKATDPERFTQLYEIIEDEIARSDHEHGHSCTKGLLWLKRAMEFMVSILRRLVEDPASSMSDAVYDTYYATLHRWHGFLASSAFSVAFAFVPSRETFLDRLAGGKFSDQTAADMTAFVEQFSALLAEVHTFLDARGLDDPAKV